MVKYFDPRDIPNEAYGGEEKVYFLFKKIKWKYFNTMDGQQGQTTLKEKIRNAYLLFYDRVSPMDEPQENTEEENSGEKSPSKKRDNEESKAETNEEERKIQIEIEKEK